MSVPLAVSPLSTTTNTATRFTAHSQTLTVWPTPHLRSVTDKTQSGTIECRLRVVTDDGVLSASWHVMQGSLRIVCVIYSCFTVPYVPRPMMCTGIRRKREQAMFVEETLGAHALYSFHTASHQENFCPLPLASDKQTNKYMKFLKRR
jgi:hypothetical protein